MACHSLSLLQRLQSRNPSTCCVMSSLLILLRWENIPSSLNLSEYAAWSASVRLISHSMGLGSFGERKAFCPSKYSESSMGHHAYRKIETAPLLWSVTRSLHPSTAHFSRTPWISSRPIVVVVSLVIAFLSRICTIRAQFEGAPSTGAPKCLNSGAPGEIRTPDPLVRSYNSACTGFQSVETSSQISR